ncbi:MAG: DUF975 family protein [Clostridia bacterium]|nr:DUF975 family protein [Clostridia bacterium]
MTISDYKTRAKEALGGKIFGDLWMTALLVVLVESVAATIAGTIIPGVGLFLITGPLSAGLAFAFVKQIKGTKMSVTDLLRGFTVNFGDNFILGLLQSIFIFLWSLLFVIPGLVKTYSYAMCFYIKNDNPNLSAIDCITESRKLMNGHKGQLFLLDLSFIGWYIVGALCFGIGILWVIPYHTAARTAFYDSIKSEPVVNA